MRYCHRWMISIIVFARALTENSALVAACNADSDCLQTIDLQIGHQPGAVATPACADDTPVGFRRDITRPPCCSRHRLVFELQIDAWSARLISRWKEHFTQLWR